MHLRLSPEQYSLSTGDTVVHKNRVGLQESHVCLYPFVCRTDVSICRFPLGATAVSLLWILCPRCSLYLRLLLSPHSPSSAVFSSFFFPCLHTPTCPCRSNVRRRLAYPAYGWSPSIIYKRRRVDPKGQTGKCQKGQKINDKCAHYNKAWHWGNVRWKLMERLTEQPLSLLKPDTGPGAFLGYLLLTCALSSAFTCDRTKTWTPPADSCVPLLCFILTLCGHTPQISMHTTTAWL